MIKVKKFKLRFIGIFVACVNVTRKGMNGGGLTGR